MNVHLSTAQSMQAGEKLHAGPASRRSAGRLFCISKCNPSGVLQQGGAFNSLSRAGSSSRLARVSQRIFTVWNLRRRTVMKLWRIGEKSPARETISLKHDFVIGPQRYSELFGRPARLYHCVRCKWSFLVGGSKVVVLDEHQKPIVGEESLKRFNSLGQGPCPVLEAFMSAALGTGQAPRVGSQNGLGKPARMAPFPIPAPTARSRPVLRLLGRMRANFAK
ncbi:MAG TPA: hypothetical protein VMI09_02950 [Candidatus Binataceae bacterium]|nr:hypothetical protein [Candidatus Binataceae bacterium]